MAGPGRHRWWHPVVTRALLVVGGLAVVAVGTLGAVAAPAATTGGVLFAAVVGVLACLRARDAAPVNRPAHRATGLAVGTGVAAGWMVTTGAVVLVGPGVAVLLLVPAAVGAAVWWRTRSGAEQATSGRVLRGVAPPPPPVPAIEPTAAPAAQWRLADLSTAQLCLAWQHSYFDLLDLSPGASRTDLAGLRESLLDEIERRDPAGFTRWIDAGARPGSSPRPYLIGET